MFLLKSSEDLVCPGCGQPLKLRDHRLRVCRTEGGAKHWISVPRYICSNKSCRRLHTALPDFLCKFKHYAVEIIEDVIDGVVSENDKEFEDYPCSETMVRWRGWFARNTDTIEGWMKQAGSRHLDFSDEFLKSRVSLLKELKERISQGWLKCVLVFICNSGGCLTQ